MAEQRLAAARAATNAPSPKRRPAPRSLLPGSCPLGGGARREPPAAGLASVSCCRPRCPRPYDPAVAEQRVQDKVAELRTETERIGAQADQRLGNAAQLQPRCRWQLLRPSICTAPNSASSMNGRPASRRRKRQRSACARSKSGPKRPKARRRGETSLRTAGCAGRRYQRLEETAAASPRPKSAPSGRAARGRSRAGRLPRRRGPSPAAPAPPTGAAAGVRATDSAPFGVRADSDPSASAGTPPSRSRRRPPPPPPAAEPRPDTGPVSPSSRLLPLAPPRRKRLAPPTASSTATQHSAPPPPAAELSAPSCAAEPGGLRAAVPDRPQRGHLRAAARAEPLGYAGDRVARRPRAAWRLPNGR